MKVWLGLVLLLMLCSLKCFAGLWKAENSWSDDWEKKYSAWIQQEVNPQFLKQNGISTDCADAVISLRWIFSRINLLPMASNSSSGKLISNLSSSWDRLPTGVRWSQDQRFLKALVDVNNATSSKTLFKDLYPVKLTIKQLVSGTVFVDAAQDSGHAEWIAQTEFDGQHAPLLFYSSTVPQQVREFLVYPFMKIKWPEKNKNGFMRFRWPVLNASTVQLTAAEVMSGYSLEQYELTDRDSIDFDDFITTRLMGQPIDGLHKLQILASHLADRIENRIPVVIEGFNVCGEKKCPDQNSSKFYDHSTYSRDGAIIFLIQGIFELIYSNRYLQNVDDQMAGQMTLKWSQIQTDVTFDIQSQNYNLGQIVSIWNQGLFSSDPNLSIEARWGIQSVDAKTK